MLSCLCIDYLYVYTINRLLRCNLGVTRFSKRRFSAYKGSVISEPDYFSAPDKKG